MEQETSWLNIHSAVVTYTLPRMSVCERLFPKLSKKHRRLAAWASTQELPVFEQGSDWDDILRRRLEARTHIEYTCSRNEYINGVGGPFVRSNARAVLALLCGRPDQSFYTREIAREVDASVGAVQRELENLSKVGLILRKSVGSQVFYQANRDTPIFQEMRTLINKTIGIFGVLRSALHPLSKRIVAAFVYGSVAREEETAQSDVDLMVVGKATLNGVLSQLSTAEKDIGRSVNPTVYSAAEFKGETGRAESFFDLRAERPEAISAGR